MWFSDQSARPSAGFTLLECLLALVVGVTVSLMTFRYWRYTEQQSALGQVRSDVQHLAQVLTRYYREAGCDRDGQFAGDLSPSLASLGLKMPGRSPLTTVSNPYAFRIVADTVKKQPIYRLHIEAQFAAVWSVETMKRFAAALQATDMRSHTLIWEYLPAVSALSGIGDAWSETGSQSTFRHLETKTMQRLQMPAAAVSASYCTE